MRHLTVTHKPQQQGFTFLELLVVVILAGIMAAISAPGMLGFLNRAKVSSAHGTLLGAIQQAQREAVKRGTDCSLTLPSSPSTSSSINITGTCLTTEIETLEQVELRHDIPGNTITFNFKGETQDSLTGGDAVIIVTQLDTDSFQKCIAISRGLGIIRAGTYASNDTGVDIADCVPLS